MACEPKTFDVLPSYLELLDGIYNFTAKTFQENYGKHETSFRYINFTIHDVMFVLLISAAFTVFRFLSTKLIFTPLGAYFALTSTNIKKMPESAWKFVYYLCAWGFSYYVVILSGKYCFFQKPSTVWNGWSLDTALPLDIYLMYVFQSGFYVHSLYATLFLDTWRKDSVVMMVHHVVTLALISFSYTLRYHNIGIVVLFLHDMCDIQLEFMKLNVYFKTQNGKLVKKHEFLANLTCLSFAVTWFVSRLYWYPLKVLYSSTAIVARDDLQLPCAILMNCLLWLLQAMNVYWFLYIVGFLLRVATGQVNELDDTREYDVEEKFSQQRTSKHSSVSGSSGPPSNKEKNNTSNEESTNGIATMHNETKARKRIVT